MIINFLGDSITMGANATTVEKRYVSLVGKILDCKVNNFGIGGTRIARQKKASANPIFDEDFNMRAQKMGYADLVFVFGGTNDYGHGDAELGCFGDTDVYTFYGAFDTLLNYLIKKYGKKKLCYILPLPRRDSVIAKDAPKNSTRVPRPLCDYIKAERETLKAYGVDYLDLESDFDVLDTTPKALLSSDGLHPNDAGHKKIAERICEYIRTRKM